jgi:anti-sigma factor RsiW
MMTEEDFERLSLFRDGALPDDEMRAVEARLTEDAEWRTALAGLRRSGEMLRAQAENALENADFDAMWARVDVELAGRPAPALVPHHVAVKAPTDGAFLRWLDKVFSPRLMFGVAVAAAAVAFVMLRQGGPETPPFGKSDLVGKAPISLPPSPDSVNPSMVAEVEPARENVTVEGVESEGLKTILVSQPAEDGATVIWLLDGPDAGAAGNDDDPI